MSDVWNTLRALISGPDRDAQAGLRGRATQRLEALDARERREAHPSAAGAAPRNPVEREARDTIRQRTADRDRHRTERADAERSAARSLRTARDAQLERHASAYENRTPVDHEGVPDALRRDEVDAPYRSTAHQMLAELAGDYGRLGSPGNGRSRMGHADTAEAGFHGTDQAIRDLYNFQFRVAPEIDREGPDQAVRDATRRLNAARMETNDAEHRRPSAANPFEGARHEYEPSDHEGMIGQLLTRETSHYPEQTARHGRIQGRDEAIDYGTATRDLQERQTGPVSRPVGNVHPDRRGAADEEELRRRALQAIQGGNYSVTT